jgi:RNA polymerase sigma-70 factor, ECF subfamily
MNADRNMAKETRPRVGEARQMEGLDLESVIERARGQDAEALEEIYRRYIQRVFGLCRYMLDSRESAEDAASEVFLKLQHSIDNYDGSIPFPRWLLRITGNQCVDALRRRQRGRKVIVEVEDEAAVVEPASSEPSPLGAIISKQERAQVRDTIARLPENYRVPLVLRYYSELSYDEIAQQLGLEKNYVAALIFRGKQEMRRRLPHAGKQNDGKINRSAEFRR